MKYFQSIWTLIPRAWERCFTSLFSRHCCTSSLLRIYSKHNDTMSLITFCNKQFIYKMTVVIISGIRNFPFPSLIPWNIIRKPIFCSFFSILLIFQNSAHFQGEYVCKTVGQEINAPVLWRTYFTAWHTMSPSSLHRPKGACVAPDNTSFAILNEYGILKFLNIIWF